MIKHTEMKLYRVKTVLKILNKETYNVLGNIYIYIIDFCNISPFFLLFFIFEKVHRAFRKGLSLKRYFWQRVNKTFTRTDFS